MEICKSLSVTDLCLRFDSRSIVHDPTKRRKIMCPHPLISGGKCLRCARVVEDDYGLPFEYLYPSLRLSKDHADRVRKMRTKAMLALKKLHLVLDLDHTLVHSICVSCLTPAEEHLAAEADRNTISYLDTSTEQGERCHNEDLFVLENEKVRIITKLRPFVREFLREASNMFELSVYTMGTRWYASKIAKFLDRDGCYFGNRIITREDCTLKGRKSLDVVLARESNVVIVDDKKTVWPDHSRNLLLIKPYFYFSHGYKKPRTIRKRSAIGLRRKVIKKNRVDSGDKALSIMLGNLAKIHRYYFHTKSGAGTLVESLVNLRTS